MGQVLMYLLTGPQREKIVRKMKTTRVRMERVRKMNVQPSG
jgi:hypothetical protein